MSLQKYKKGWVYKNIKKGESTKILKRVSLQKYKNGWVYKNIKKGWVYENIKKGESTKNIYRVSKQKRVVLFTTKWFLCAVYVIVWKIIKFSEKMQNKEVRLTIFLN